MNYVSFLRAINVGGNSIVSMAALKDTDESLGFADVRTYINSGNLFFASAESDTKKLTAKIEKALEESTGLPIKVVVLTHAALQKIVDAIPSDWVDDSAMRCYVMLLWTEVDDRKILTELPMAPGVDEVKYTPGAVIWRVDRKNIRKSKMNRIIGTPVYKKMSMRSANTMRKLSELTQGGGATRPAGAIRAAPRRRQPR